jgi:hypothetical protein
VTSLMRSGGRVTSITLIFSGLASIPRCETRKPSSFSTETPNTHLSGFNFVRVERNLSKIMSRLSSKDERELI